MPEISRADHVTVDNAVLDLPRICLGDCVRSVVRTSGRSRFAASTAGHLVHTTPLVTGEGKGVVPRKGRPRKGRGMAGEPMLPDVERGNPNAVRSGAECLASARYESWLHRSRRHIYHRSPSMGFTLAGSLRKAGTRAVGHTNRCYRGLGVLAVTRLRVDARRAVVRRWAMVLVATVPGPRQGNGSPKPRRGVRRGGRDTITCTLDRGV